MVKILPKGSINFHIASALTLIFILQELITFLQKYTLLILCLNAGKDYLALRYEL
jgi:hypothetical protein